MPESELEEKEQLYIARIIREDGTEEITGYAYGLPWVAMALYMDDLKFPTPEAAKAWWDKEFGDKS